MDKAIEEKIIKWIFDNHEHHFLKDDQDDNSYVCEEGDYPYVNSIELEKFIKELARG